MWMPDDKLQLAIFTAVASAITWLYRAKYTKQKRLSAEAEKRLGPWLDAQTNLVLQLEECIEFGRKEPETADALQSLLERIDSLRNKVREMEQRTNDLVVYEYRRSVKTRVVSQARALQTLAEGMGIIVSHFQLHLEQWKPTIEEMKSYESAAKELLEFAQRHEEKSFEENVKKHLNAIENLRSEAQHKVSKCSARISDDVLGLNKMVAKLKRDADKIRLVVSA